jgi:hypothetical protein
MGWEFCGDAGAFCLKLTPAHTAKRLAVSDQDARCWHGNAAAYFWAKAGATINDYPEWAVTNYCAVAEKVCKVLKYAAKVQVATLDTVRDTTPREQGPRRQRRKPGARAITAPCRMRLERRELRGHTLWSCLGCRRAAFVRGKPRQCRGATSGWHPTHSVLPVGEQLAFCYKCAAYSWRVKRTGLSGPCNGRLAASKKRVFERLQQQRDPVWATPVLDATPWAGSEALLQPVGAFVVPPPPVPAAEGEEEPPPIQQEVQQVLQISCHSCTAVIAGVLWRCRGPCNCP